MALVKAVLDKRITASAIYQDRLATCTTCLACEAVCPSGVPVAAIIQAAREQAVAEAGIGIIKAVIAEVVKRPALFRAAAWLGPAVLHFKQGPRTRVQGPGSRVQGQGARVKGQGKSSGFRVRSLKGTGTKGRVAFFPGCAIEHFQPEIGSATVTVLTALGYETIIPEGLKCCGRPLLSLGDRRAAEELAAHNAALLARADADVIVTACASCGLTFKKDYPGLLRRGTKAPAILDIHEFLAGRLAQAALAPVQRTVTWHDPCHLSRGQGLANAAREVLRAIPGINLVEMRNADRCCGFGGVMRITRRELSDGIVEDKVKSIIATNASVVATGCPGCRMQIADALKRKESEIEVLHTVQVLEEALGIADCPGSCESAGTGGMRIAELEMTGSRGK